MTRSTFVYSDSGVGGSPTGQQIVNLTMADTPGEAAASSSSASRPGPAAGSAPALEVIGADRQWWQVGPLSPKPPTAASPPATAQTGSMCVGRGKPARRSFAEPTLRARPVRRSFAEPTPEQISKLATFTSAEPAVCGRILKDCRGDEQAAAQWLLLSGGRETMCVTLPAGQAPGSTMQISTPRGLISVTVPDGLEAGAELTFSLPEPAAAPNVARHVDGAPVPQATATMAQGAAAGPAGVAQASPPVVVIGAGRPYAYAQPGYGYGYSYGNRCGGFYDPYPYWDPYYGPYRCTATHPSSILMDPPGNPPPPRPHLRYGPYGRGYYDPYYYEPCTIL